MEAKERKISHYRKKKKIRLKSVKFDFLNRILNDPSYSVTVLKDKDSLISSLDNF